MSERIVWRAKTYLQSVVVEAPTAAKAAQLAQRILRVKYQWPTANHRATTIELLERIGELEDEK